MLNIFRLVVIFIPVIVISACDTGSSGDGIDTGIIEVPIAYIKRPIPVDDNGDQVQADLRKPRLFSAGGDVYLRTNSTSSASVTNISGPITGGTGDVKGLNASFDGTKLIFSARLFDPDPNDDIIPSWNIYEYDQTTSTLRPVVPAAISGLGDDLFPAYLPDDRIVFSSSRQRSAQGNLFNEGKPLFSAMDEDEATIALVLHVMNSDGSDIHQISSNQSHDLHPQVLENSFGGQIVFSRWDNAMANNAVTLYKVNPDGSDLEILYGAHSHATGTGGSDVQFANVREMPNGELMVIAKAFTGTFDGGAIYVLDSPRFADINKPVYALRSLTSQGQKSVTVSNVTTDGSISLGGRYSSAYPLRDGTPRMLVSRSTCQLNINGTLRPCVGSYLNGNPVEESPAYGIWLYDLDKDTAKPIILAEPGQVITEVITIQTELRPPVIFDKGPGLIAAWEAANVGVVNIKSVYDMGNETFNGCFFNLCVSDLVDAGETVTINAVEDFVNPVLASAKHRPARFVRFIKPVGIPDPDDPAFPDLRNQAFGLQRQLGMREIVGYAPIEPDGSVMVKVPANVPLALEVLDAGGRRIGPRHSNWFQVLPGDTLTCGGCHTHDTPGASPEAHGRFDATAPSINGGIQASPILNTQIPGTVQSYFTFNLGETMAEIRFARVGSAIPAAPEPQLTTDLTYEDYWTAPAVVRPDNVTIGPDASFNYAYDKIPVPVDRLEAGLDASILAPAGAAALRNTNCNSTVPSVQQWNATCRVAINYPRHIEAIWQLDRDLNGIDDFAPLAPADPADPLDPTATPLLMDVVNLDGIGDETCVSCHTSSVAAVTRLPYGQLDLSIDPAQLINDFPRSFLELLQSKLGQMEAGGVLVDIPGGARVQRRMSPDGARSSFFIEKMSGQELDDLRILPVGSVDHTSMLTNVELKLISEWLDLGAQNFNDPFDTTVPTN